MLDLSNSKNDQFCLYSACETVKRTNINKFKNKAKLANKVRRVDRRTNALPTDQQTDGRTDTASYRGALAHLKTVCINISFRWSESGNSTLRNPEPKDDVFVYYYRPEDETYVMSK